MSSTLSSRSLMRLALLTLVIRALFFFQQMGSPFFGKPLLDQHYYDLVARQLAGGGGDLIDGFRPLLYPLFISVFYSLNLDWGMLLSIVAQHALGIAMALMVARLACGLFEIPKAGLISGTLFLLSAPPLYFESQLLITTFFSFLLLLLSGIIFKALRYSNAPREATLWLAAGVVMGLAAQARPNALPLLLFFPLLSIVRLARRGQMSRFKSAALPLIAIPGLLLIQTVFATINARYSGEFQLMTQAGGINFYLGNGLKADGMIPKQDRHVSYEGEYRDPIQVMADEGYREATGNDGPASPKTVSRFWKEKTIREIKSDPPRWLGLMAKKGWLMLWNHEVPNNRSFEFTARNDITMLRWLPVRWWLLLALFPGGIAALLKRGQGEYAIWSLSFIALYAGTIVLFFVNSRFRIPLWPVMAVIAGGGAVHLWTSIKSKSIPRIPLACGIAVLPISLFNWFDIPPDPIENDLSMRASAYLDQGRAEEALVDMAECVRIAPHNPRYHFVLGNALLATEQYTAAQQAYLKAISLDPTDPLFHNNLGIVFEYMEKPDSALVAYHNALALRPNHVATKTNLMLLHVSQNNFAKAEALLVELLHLDGNNSTLACAKLVLVHKQTGQRDALERAREINPALVQQLLKK